MPDNSPRSVSISGGWARRPSGLLAAARVALLAPTPERRQWLSPHRGVSKEVRRNVIISIVSRGQPSGVLVVLPITFSQSVKGSITPED